VKKAGRGKAGQKSSKVEGEPVFPTEQGSEYLQDLAEMYFCDLRKFENPDASSDAADGGDDGGDEAMNGVTEIGFLSPIDGTSSAKFKDTDNKQHNVLSLEADDGCINGLCKRKRRGIDCIHGFCVQCCIETAIAADAPGAYCPGHYAQKVKKEQEDRYILEGLNLSHKKQAKFKDYEEAFSDFKQTVTVWCSRDFFRCKAFSGEAIADAANAERRLDAMRKRKQARNLSSYATLNNSGSSSSSSSSSSCISGGGGDKKCGAAAPSHEQDIQVQAWQAVKQDEDAESKSNWERMQKSWLRQEQEQGVKSTAWLLKVGKEAK
jgi:hypothetical protein